MPDAPGLMLHDQEVGEPDERSVKATVPPGATVVGVPEKFATGAVGAEHGSEDPAKVRTPVLLGSSHGFNCLLAAVPLDVQ